MAQVDIRVTTDTSSVFPEIVARLLAAIRIGVAKALPAMGRRWAMALEQAAPFRTGRLQGSFVVTPRQHRNTFDLLVNAVFYAAPVNARTRFVDRAFRDAESDMLRILEREVGRAVNRAFPIGG